MLHVVKRFNVIVDYDYRMGAPVRDYMPDMEWHHCESEREAEKLIDELAAAHDDTMGVFRANIEEVYVKVGCMKEHERLETYIKFHKAERKARGHRNGRG